MTVELSGGADRDGFCPFPGALTIPDSPMIPGDLTYWKPLWSDVQIAYNYAAQVFAGTRDKTLLNLLAQHGIGDRT